MSLVERNPHRLFSPPAVDVERRADGAILLRSRLPLQDYARCVAPRGARHSMLCA